MLCSVGENHFNTVVSSITGRVGACRYMRLPIDDYGSITFIKYILNRDKVGGDFK